MPRSVKSRGRSKYRNRKVTIDGITFASAHEADRYRELSLMQRAGLISGMELQKPYELIPAQYETVTRYGKKGQRLKDGRKCLEKSVVYIADFVYDQNGETIVEDAKGMRTPDYIIKRKLMLYVRGIRIREV